MNRSKIALIGAGNIGSNLAYLAAVKNLAEEIVLLDLNANFAKGKALDVAQSLAIDHDNVSLIGTNDYADIAGAKVAIITAGLPRKPGMSREDLIKTNVEVMKIASQGISKYAPDAFVIVVTNPLDAMTWVVHKVTGFSKNMVVGMSGILDSARMKYSLSREFNIAAETINTLVLGSHGDTMVPLLSYTTVSGVPIKEMVRLDMITDAKLNAIIEKTKNGGVEVVNLMGSSAYYTPASSAIHMATAYLHNKRSIMPCSVLFDGEYGFYDVYCGMPVIVGESGASDILMLKFEDTERQMLLRSIAAAKELIKIINL